MMAPKSLVILVVALLASAGCKKEDDKNETPGKAKIVRKDAKKDPIMKLGEWRLVASGVRRTSSISGGVATYSAKAGFSFYEVGFELRASAAKPKSLEIDLRALAVRDGQGNSYHSEAMLFPASVSAYCYGPMLDGKLSSKYRCRTVLGDCNPLVGGKASLQVGGLTLEIAVEGQTVTATLSPPAGEKLRFRIAFYLPKTTDRVELRWPGQSPISLQIVD